MSWGALPWWVYESMYQREIMRVSGAMIEELFSGWNHGRISNCYDSLTQGVT